MQKFTLQFVNVPVDQRCINVPLLVENPYFSLFIPVTLRVSVSDPTKHIYSLSGSLDESIWPRSFVGPYKRCDLGIEKLDSWD